MTTSYAYEPDSIATVPVADVMHRGLVTCRPDASLFAVARTMAAHRIHAVVVAPENETEEWTVISDLDLVGAFGRGLFGVATARTISSSPNLSLRPDDTVARAARLMCEYDTNHLVVAGSGPRPVGVVSTLDIADVVGESPHRVPANGGVAR